MCCTVTWQLIFFPACLGWADYIQWGSLCEPSLQCHETVPPECHPAAAFQTGTQTLTQTHTHKKHTRTHTFYFTLPLAIWYIYLWFYPQFIDGRLDLLNSGEGFSDIFEDEINMGEYAGESAVMFCVLATKKASGMISFCYKHLITIRSSSLSSSSDWCRNNVSNVSSKKRMKIH